MAGVKISSLSASNLQSLDYFPIARGGNTYKTVAKQLLDPIAALQTQMAAVSAKLDNTVLVNSTGVNTLSLYSSPTTLTPSTVTNLPNGNVGINTTNPAESLTINGCMMIEGTNGDYKICVQDGTGRVNHYWNADGPATVGGLHTFRKENETATRILMGGADQSPFAVYTSQDATNFLAASGDPITWYDCMYIDRVNDRNVGIGTVAPIRRLHVANLNSGEMVLEQTSAMSGFKKWNFVVDGGNSSTSSNFIIRQLNDTGNSAGDPFYINGTTNYTGIGTVTPNARLTVRDPLSSGINGTVHIQSGAGDAHLRIDSFNTSSDVYQTLSQGNVGKFQIGLTTDGNSNFYINPNCQQTPAETNSALFIQKSNSFVGIGTETPFSKLYVEGGNIGIDTGNLLTLSTGSNQTSIGRNGSTNGIDFKTSSLPRMFIADDGKVGINTSTPDNNSLVKLHVVGSIVAETGSGTKAYIGGDSNADIEIGSLDAACTDITFWNIGSSLRMNLFAKNITSSGNIEATGDVIAYATSDQRLKTNITYIPNSLEKVCSIRGVTFNWNTELQQTHKGRDVGVIAQEIERVLPEAVIDRENGYKAVKYEKIIPLLIEAIKELKFEIADMKRISLV